MYSDAEMEDVLFPHMMTDEELDEQFDACFDEDIDENEESVEYPRGWDVIEPHED
jgi:hypothetical protein